MNKKKIVLFVFFGVGVLSLILTYKFKQNNLNKNKPVKEEKLSIMIKEQGATDYTKSNSKDIPKGNYVLNEKKTHCENNGEVTSYDNATGTVSFAFIGSDKCYLYFDYKIPTRKAYDAILLDNGNGATTVDEAKAYISGKGTPTFTDSVTTNEGMYATEDDLGTSYYFRGAVDNNWLKFGEVDGKPIYWRIIRINGDSSIRLLYTGTTSPTESQKVEMTGENTQIGVCSFVSVNTSSEYVGYKYEIGKQHGLAKDSDIKTTLENWYKTTTLYTNEATSKLVVDTPFCYDRTASESTTGTYGEISSWASTGTQYYYGSWGRIYGNKTGPSLKCQNELDIYSVANGTLSYPVGLITADEINMAGADNDYTSNSSYYLYTGQNYWCGSPDIFSGNYSSSFVFYVRSSGALGSHFVNYSYGVRGSVSLSSEAKLSGDGSWNNPYVVEG